MFFILHVTRLDCPTDTDTDSSASAGTAGTEKIIVRLRAAEAKLRSAKTRSREVKRALREAERTREAVVRAEGNLYVVSSASDESGANEAAANEAELRRLRERISLDDGGEARPSRVGRIRRIATLSRQLLRFVGPAEATEDRETRREAAAEAGPAEGETTDTESTTEAETAEGETRVRPPIFSRTGATTIIEAINTGDADRARRQLTEATDSMEAREVALREETEAWLREAAEARRRIMEAKGQRDAVLRAEMRARERASKVEEAANKVEEAATRAEEAVNLFKESATGAEEAITRAIEARDARKAIDRELARMSRNALLSLPRDVAWAMVVTKARREAWLEELRSKFSDERARSNESKAREREEISNSTTVVIDTAMLAIQVVEAETRLKEAKNVLRKTEVWLREDIRDVEAGSGEAVSRVEAGVRVLKGVADAALDDISQASSQESERR